MSISNSACVTPPPCHRLCCCLACVNADKSFIPILNLTEDEWDTHTHAHVCTHTHNDQLTVVVCLSVHIPSTDEPLKITLSPRNATVLQGSVYSLECAGWQRMHPVSLYTFFDQTYRMMSLGSFEYPQDTGFPVYRVENVSFAHDASCFFCEFGPHAIGPTYSKTSTHKAFLTIVCEWYSPPVL